MYTKDYEDNNIECNAKCYVGGCNEDACSVMEQLKQLAAYEKTGLTPEQIMELKNSKFIPQINIGTKVYYARLCTQCYESHINECEVIKIIKTKQYTVFETNIGQFNESDINNKVFLSSEEAENKLINKVGD